jgi:small neutral amino acid transporter SnatA (MarC family)
MAGGFIKPKAVDKAMIAADPAAAAMGYLSTILATFGIFEKMGLSADQVAILGGAILGLLATARHFYEKNRRASVVLLHEMHEKLKKQTLTPGSLTLGSVEEAAKNTPPSP